MQHGFHALQTDTRKIPGIVYWHDFTRIQTYNIGTQGVQELFFCDKNPLEVAALSGLLRVMIRVTHSCILVPDSRHSMSL